MKIFPERTEPAAVMDKGGRIIEKSSGFLRGLYSLFPICILLLMVGGCLYREDAGIAVPEGKVVFDRIAVVPFQQIVPEESRSGTVCCPLCGLMVDATRSSGSPEALVEDLFLKQLDKGKRKFGLIAGERVAAVFRRVSAISLKIPLRQVLRDVGSELGAEGVVSGYVYRFRERKGVSYAVEQPASVAFEIHLLRVSDGALVWRGYFDRTQSSLMEDLLKAPSFYRGGGRWVTAEQLAEEGLEQIVKTFPGMQ